MDSTTASAMLSFFEMLLTARENGDIPDGEILPVPATPAPVLFHDEISGILRQFGRAADIRMIDNSTGLSAPCGGFTHQAKVNGIFDAIESGYTVTINGIDITEL